ncbi:MAG: hypothetical protein QNK20_13805 [Aureibaculum sp.]|nr:hypothetical protein [Aureibaculum sp.]
MNYTLHLIKLGLLKGRLLFQLLILLSVFATSTSCSSGKTIASVTIDTDCPPVMDYIDSDFRQLDSLMVDTLLTSTYSKKSIVVANAYGLISDIRELQTLNNNKFKLKSNDSLRLKILEKNREIDKTLYLAALEIKTLQTFLNCNNLKLIKTKTDLAAANNKTRNTYTNAALITGLVSSVLVAGAVIDDGELNEGSFKDWVGITGGLVAAGLAVISVKVDKKVNLSHEHNAIAAIWNGNNDHGVFTDNTWYLLNQPSLVDSSERSMRELILHAWKTSNSMLQDEDHAEHTPIIIGNGGKYTEEMIQLRMNMLEEVKQKIEDIARLLSLLTYENE